MKNFNVRRVVIGHTPTGGKILSNYGGAVLAIDAGLAEDGDEGLHRRAIGALEDDAAVAYLRPETAKGRFTLFPHWGDRWRNPLLDEVSMKGAKGLLISITGGKDLTLFEVDEAVKRIKDEFGKPMKVVSTGGLAPVFDGSTDVIDQVVPDITARGLIEIWRRSKRAGWR